MNEKNLCCDGTYIIEKGILNKYIELDWVKCRGERKLRGEREGKKRKYMIEYKRCMGVKSSGLC